MLTLPDMKMRLDVILPLAMSGAALITVLCHLALFGTAREPDEGAAAHLFQLLIVGQLPIALFFVVGSVRRSMRETFAVLALQGVAILLALTPVWYFSL